jgi:hypothetical protein
MKYRRDIKVEKKPRSLFVCKGCFSVYYRKKTASSCCRKGAGEVTYSNRIVIEPPEFLRKLSVHQKRKIWK